MIRQQEHILKEEQTELERNGKVFRIPKERPGFQVTKIQEQDKRLPEKEHLQKVIQIEHIPELQDKVHQPMMLLNEVLQLDILDLRVQQQEKDRQLALDQLQVHQVIHLTEQVHQLDQPPEVVNILQLVHHQVIRVEQ